MHSSENGEETDGQMEGTALKDTSITVEWYERNFIRPDSMLFKILGRLGFSTLEVSEVRKMVKKSKIRNRDTITGAVKKDILEPVGKRGIRATLKGMALYEARRLDITPLSLMMLIHIKYRMEYSKQYHRDCMEFWRMYCTYVDEQKFNIYITDLISKGLLTQISKDQWRISERLNQKIAKMVFDRMIELTK